MSVKRQQVDDSAQERTLLLSVSANAQNPSENARPDGALYPTNKISSTKYSAWSFLPVCLFQQLKSVINSFFIVNGMLQSIPAISTNSPLASFIPVGWVIIMGMVFELVSDLRRYSSDKETNNYEVERAVKSGSGIEKKMTTSADLKVGDIIVLQHDSKIPADCIVLQTDGDLGQCFINTSQLDGERNLKPKLTPQMFKDEIQQILSGDQKYQVEYIPPHKDIYKFEGKLVNKESKQELILDLKQFIPRGAMVKDSTNLYAMIVYTGKDTKLVLNQGQYKFKISSLAYQLNIILLLNLCLMFFQMIVMSQIGTRIWLYTQNEGHWYIFPQPNEPINKEGYVWKAFLSFYLLFNALIPLDLAVNIILTKMFYSIYVEADAEFVDEEKSIDAGKPVGCSVRNLTMLEDVARITHVFCDKTGTLTQNKLIFRCLAFNDKEFRLEEDSMDRNMDVYSKEIKEYQNQAGDLKDRFTDLLRCICICHDAIQIKEADKTKKVRYSGASMDEVTFLEMCRDSGFVSFIERDSDKITISVNGVIETYKILKVLEFTSDRKRMSVIVENCESGELINYIKGADMAIVPRIDKDAPFDQSCIEKMDELANEGLRTLMFAKKVYDGLIDAQTIKDISDENLEEQLILLGVSALEDLLQVKCAECIQDLRAAKIKVWMLTGDKGETAQSIGISCGLIDENKHNIFKIKGETKESISKEVDSIEKLMQKMILKNSGQNIFKDSDTVRNKENDMEMKDITGNADINQSILSDQKMGEQVEIIRSFSIKYRKVAKNLSESAILISGSSLTIIFEDEMLSERMSYLFKASSSVVVFRSSPDEKAQTVKFIMKHEPEAFTLAIGDGANDVNMIQSANIGVGIMGKEGNQAAAFSDYALPNFKGLRRLMLWHGRQFGTRAVTFLNFSLFKSQSFMVPILVINLANGFSGLALFSGLYYALFDVCNTVLMLGSYLLLDQDISFNHAQYKDDADKTLELKSSYDPNIKKTFAEMREINPFDRDQMLKDNGIQMNSDGSTNNMAEYTWYCRDTKLFMFKSTYAYFLIWAYISGSIIFLISMYSFGEKQGPDGQVNNYWNAGVSVIITIIISHHIMMINECRNLHWFLMIFQGVSFGFLFLTISSNDSIEDSPFYKNQWSLMLSDPIFYLVVSINCFIVMLPRYLYLIYEHVYQHPEFTKIKGL